jgi:urea transport system ATP-binding protein
MGFQSKMPPEEILRVEDVTLVFGDFTALNELNFSLERGELRVVIGPNGAGKTTLLDVVTGKVRPRSGRILFQPDANPQRDITRLPEPQIARLGIGRKFQTPNVFKSLTVLENLWLALKSPRGSFPPRRSRARRGNTANDRPGGQDSAASRFVIARREAVAGTGHAHGSGSGAAARR